MENRCKDTIHGRRTHRSHLDLDLIARQTEGPTHSTKASDVHLYPITGLISNTNCDYKYFELGKGLNISTFNEKNATVKTVHGGDRESYKSLSECQGAVPVLGSKED